MKVSKITIGRLYNLGGYEHVRYELTVEVPASGSAAMAIVGMEKVLAALSPKTSTHDRATLAREERSIEEMRRLLTEKGVEEFKRHHGYSFVGTADEYIARCEESHARNVAARDEWETRSKRARQLLDDLGGAANWKDAKLEWGSDDDFDPRF